jgi:protein ImuA
MSALPRTSADFLDAIHADVWHADALSDAPAQVLSTGNAVLDAQLPGGGWPVGVLIEILQTQGVHSEWRLLLPALARSGQGPVVLVGAPHTPFAPWLASQALASQRLLWVNAPATPARLWAAEQALRCADVDAVLLWLDGSRKQPVRSDALRRLHMAAAEHQKLLFVMRPDSAQREASPAALRLSVAAQPPLSDPFTNLAADGSAGIPADALAVQLLKRRGPPLVQPLQLTARAQGMATLLAASHHHALDRTSTRA